MKYRQIGPFRTSAIAYGSMPLSIEGRPAVSYTHLTLPTNREV